MNRTVSIDVSANIPGEAIFSDVVSVALAELAKKIKSGEASSTKRGSVSIPIVLLDGTHTEANVEWSAG